MYSQRNTKNLKFVYSDKWSVLGFGITPLSHIKGSYQYVSIGVRDGVYDIDASDISWMLALCKKTLKCHCKFWAERDLVRWGEEDRKWK